MKYPLSSTTILLVWITRTSGSFVNETQAELRDENTPRMITQKELSQKTEANSSPADIWLSVLGEIYNVTEGKDRYYGKGMGYESFVGTDATVPFVTGKFTAEEARKSPLQTLGRSFEQLVGIDSWRNFYRQHPVYGFVGYLVDERYFDNDGNPTIEKAELERRMRAAKKKKEEVERNRKARSTKKPGTLSNEEIIQRIKRRRRLQQETRQ